MKSAIQLGTLLLLTVSASVRATPVERPADRGEPKKQWVWLQTQGVWGFGYQLQDGPHRGFWRIDPGMKFVPAPAGDPYGFAAVVNRLRAEAGLAALTYDAELSAWAAQNNAVQNAKGIGHHVNPNCFQNCAWNFGDAESVAEGWMNSSGHRANMLNPAATRFGIAYGPGPYWTMNAQ